MIRVNLRWMGMAALAVALPLAADEVPDDAGAAPVEAPPPVEAPAPVETVAETPAPADVPPPVVSEIPVAQAAPVADPERYRNRGPYVGGGLGYNIVDDQVLDFRGSSTDPSQPTVPVEFQQTKHTGRAAENEYKGNIFGQAMIGYKFANGLRPEFEIGYRQNDADDIIEYGDPARQSEPNNPGTGQDVTPSTVNDEPGASVQTESAVKNVKITTTTGLFNLWYDLFPTWRFHPYIGGGVGLARYKLHKQPTNRLTQGTATNSTTNDTNPGPPLCPQQDCQGPRKSDDARFAYQGGAGVRWDMTDTLTIGLDYRYLKGGKGKFFAFEDQQATVFETDYQAQSLMLSANYFFALPVPPPPPVVTPVAVVAPLAICSDTLDNDGDGQVDFPNDPGCAAADDNDETDPPQCSDGKDNDGDALIDFPSDKGCTGADDNDEVDPCKTPAPGERISLKGCGLGDVIVLRGVNFEFDKSRLTANAKTILDNVSEELAAYPEIEVELSGHTDSKGSDPYNQSLSDRRSKSVKSYLVGKGIAGSRMTTAGFGESQPVADNETDEGRELNRRTELKVTKGVAPGGPTVAEQTAGEAAVVADPATTDGSVPEPTAETPPPADGATIAP